jgi:hypothetical protein
MNNNQTKHDSEKVQVKFTVDESSKEAAEKLKTSNFVDSVKRDSDKVLTISRLEK